ncbi:MAG: von Willebrand factor type A domain-containing protein [Verrucomicrobiota bacterium]|nr:von Willebrand factor type A domain-containing protein [Verrucomicrobiota bacterium]
MNLHPDDPKLTAYALGELLGDEAAAVEEAIAQSAEAQAWVSEVGALAGTMRAEFGADLFERKPLNIMPLPAARSFWSVDRWGSIAAAAVVAIAAIPAAVVLVGSSPERSSIARTRLAGEPADVQMEFETDSLDADIAPAGTLTGQGDRFVSAADNPIATFPLRVGKASYGDVQRAIASGSLPARAAVRIEELINYFTYDDPSPQADRPFAISAEVAGCPWRPEHRLMRVALKAQGTSSSGRGTLLAQDVTAQVEFSPSRVNSYRLIGYDQALSGGGSGEIHSGDAVTLLYEIVPADALSSAAEAAVVRVHYMAPSGGEALVAEALAIDDGRDFVSASPDFKFTAAVAEFGMFLRSSSVEYPRTLSAIVELANDGLGFDPDGRRAEFITLIRQAQRLTNG